MTTKHIHKVTGIPLRTIASRIKSMEIESISKRGNSKVYDPDVLEKVRNFSDRNGKEKLKKNRFYLLEYYFIMNKPETKEMAIDLNVSISYVNNIVFEWKKSGCVVIPSKING